MELWDSSRLMNCGKKPKNLLQYTYFFQGRELYKKLSNSWYFMQSNVYFSLTAASLFFLSVPDKCSVLFPSYFRLIGIFFFQISPVYYKLRFSFRFSSMGFQYIFVFSKLATFPARFLPS